jgi:hypothetical protein
VLGYMKLFTNLFLIASQNAQLVSRSRPVRVINNSVANRISMKKLNANYSLHNAHQRSY